MQHYRGMVTNHLAEEQQAAKLCTLIVPIGIYIGRIKCDTEYCVMHTLWFSVLRMRTGDAMVKPQACIVSGWA